MNPTLSKIETMSADSSPIDSHMLINKAADILVDSIKSFEKKQGLSLECLVKEAPSIPSESHNSSFIGPDGMIAKVDLANFQKSEVITQSRAPSASFKTAEQKNQSQGSTQVDSANTSHTEIVSMQEKDALLESVECHSGRIYPVLYQDVSSGLRNHQKSLEDNLDSTYPFHGPVYYEQIMQSIQESAELCVDVETKKLTPWAPAAHYGMTIKIGNTISAKDYFKIHGGGWKYSGGLRVISIATDRYDWAIDVELFKTEEDKQKLMNIVQSMSGKVWTGHNLQFDYMWLKHLCPSVRPAFLIDTMLMAIAIRADLPFQMRKMVADCLAGEIDDNGHALEYLKAYIDQKMAKRNNAAEGLDDDSDDGALSLLSLSLYYEGSKLDKGYQKPHNWCVEVLSHEHFEYCLGDITIPKVIARRMLGLKDDVHAEKIHRMIQGGKKKIHHSNFLVPSVDVAWQPDFSEAEVVSKVNSVQHKNYSDYGFTTYRIFEKAVHNLVHMQWRGLMFSTKYLQHYQQEQIHSRDEHMQSLIDLDEEVLTIKDKLISEDAGMDDEFKETMGRLIERHTGKILEKGKNGKVKLGAQILKGLDAKNPLIKHYLALQRAVSRIKKIKEYLQATDAFIEGMQEGFHDVPLWKSRVHSFISIKTVTGRTGSEMPNTQNPVSDKEFRYGFCGSPTLNTIVSPESGVDKVYTNIRTIDNTLEDGRWEMPHPDLLIPTHRDNRMLAIDYSSIEMRIAAALGKRAYNSMSAIWSKTERGARPFCKQTEVIDKEYTALLESRMNWIFRNEAIQDAFMDNQVPAHWPKERPRMMEGATIEDFAFWYARRLLELKIKIESEHKGILMLPDAYKNNIDPHLLTGLSIRQRKSNRLDIDEPIYDYLLRISSDGSKVKELKEIIGLERKAAKAENFGLLYGMSADKLWRYGAIQFGLDWTHEEADIDRDAWFDMYAEISLWHLVTEMTAKVKCNIYDGNNHMRNKENAGGHFLQSTTLTGRMVFADKINKILNYQDQGTGAEIALHAIGKLSDEKVSFQNQSFKLSDLLVNFVHDEMVLDFPVLGDTEAEQKAWEKMIHDRVEKCMVDSAQELVGDKYDIQFTVEGEIGDYWIH